MGKAEYHDLESITLVNGIQALRQMGPLSQAATKAVLWTPVNKCKVTKSLKPFRWCKTYRWIAKNTGYVHIAQHSAISLGLSRGSRVHYSEMRTACPTQERETSLQMVSCAHWIRNSTWFHSAPLNLKMYTKLEWFLLSFISPLNIFNECFSASQVHSCSSLRVPLHKLQKLLSEWREVDKALEQAIQTLVYCLGCWLSACEGRNWGCSWLIYWIMDTLKKKKNWNKKRHRKKKESFEGLFTKT